MFVDPCIIVKFIKKNPTRCTSVSKFIIPYLYEAQHVSGDTPPIIRSLKLHWQPLVFHTWKVIGRVVGGRLYSLPNIVRIVKSRQMSWAGHVARMGEDRGVHRVLVGKPE
jgi:hypothetical protein